MMGNVLVYATAARLSAEDDDVDHDVVSNLTVSMLELIADAEERGRRD